MRALVESFLKIRQNPGDSIVSVNVVRFIQMAKTKETGQITLSPGLNCAVIPSLKKMRWLSKTTF
jgi:hypothetical protein